MAETLITGSLETQAGFNPDNIRKALNGGVWMGLYGVASVITTLTAVNGQVKIPDSYESVGRLSDDGIEFDTDIKMAEVHGFGSSSVLRRDIQSKDMTVQFSMLETKRIAMEVQAGLNLRSTEMSAAGEFKFTHPPRPATLYWRTLVLGKDGEGDGLYYMARYYPRMTIADKAKDKWQDKDALMREVTLGADVDATVGGPCVEFLFGPGALAAADALGITVASS